MAVFEVITQMARPISEVFNFLSQPANLIHVSPPDLNMRLVEGPERLFRGARIVVQGKRWGVAQKITSEVTAFEEDVLIVDEQREGPFGHWIHSHGLENLNGGTRMTDRIDFAAPGGLLGFVMTAERIRKDLEWVFTYRTQKMHELFGKK